MRQRQGRGEGPPNDEEDMGHGGEASGDTAEGEVGHKTDLDLQALQARGLGPADVVNALNTQNLILPSGTAKMGETEYNVSLDASPDAIQGLNDLFATADDNRWGVGEECRYAPFEWNWGAHTMA